MKLKSNNKVNALFEMSSLTDIIFLLLIFFMLTSTLVAPNAIKINLPSATGQTIASQSIFVSIDENNQFYINEMHVHKEQLEAQLVKAINSSEEESPTVVIRADKLSNNESLVNVLKLGPKYDLKVILATKVE